MSYDINLESTTTYFIIFYFYVNQNAITALNRVKATYFNERDYEN